MGVIKDAKDLFGYDPTHDMNNFELDPATSSEDEPIIPSVKRRVPRQPPQLPNDLAVLEHINRRRKGAKQARRCDNLRDLMSMVEKEDIELDFNIFEPTISAFTELFNEREKMQAWNDFVNSTEEEQMEILQQDRRLPEKSNPQQTQGCPDSPGLNLSSWEQVIDKRATHPSFSAEECFMKLDKNIRMMLKKRQRPMGMLINLEEELINFFSEWPSSVYISKLSSSYERMMLHALCQYLDLMSKSHDCEGLRQTQVENPHPSFSPPPVLLTQYLERGGKS